MKQDNQLFCKSSFIHFRVGFNPDVRTVAQRATPNVERLCDVRVIKDFKLFYFKNYQIDF